jgi:hypothetical protein
MELNSRLMGALDAADRIFRLWSLMRDVPDLIDKRRQDDALTLFALLDDEVGTTISTLREDLEAARTVLCEPTQ